jgi:hypothetical protein
MADPLIRVEKAVSCINFATKQLDEVLTGLVNHISELEFEGEFVRAGLPAPLRNFLTDAVGDARRHLRSRRLITYLRKRVQAEVAFAAASAIDCVRGNSLQRKKIRRKCILYALPPGPE